MLDEPTTTDDFAILVAGCLKTGMGRLKALRAAADATRDWPGGTQLAKAVQWVDIGGVDGWDRMLDLLEEAAKQHRSRALALLVAAYRAEAGAGTADAIIAVATLPTRSGAGA